MNSRDIYKIKTDKVGDWLWWLDKGITQLVEWWFCAEMGNGEKVEFG